MVVRFLFLSIFCFSIYFSSTKAEESRCYKVTLESLWNGSKHKRLPRSAHFSPPVIVVHNEDYQLFRMNHLVSSSFEALAELGLTASIERELRNTKQLQHVKNFAIGQNIFVHPKHPLFNGITRSFYISVSASHPFLSLASMIAPSPDWVAGVPSLRLYHKDNGFSQGITQNLYALDAGTERNDVAGNFSINNRASNPQTIMTSLQAFDGFQDPFAKIMIEEASMGCSGT